MDQNSRTRGMETNLSSPTLGPEALAGAACDDITAAHNGEEIVMDDQHGGREPEQRPRRPRRVPDDAPESTVTTAMVPADGESGSAAYAWGFSAPPPKGGANDPVKVSYTVPREMTATISMIQSILRQRYGKSPRQSSPARCLLYATRVCLAYLQGTRPPTP